MRRHLVAILAPLVALLATPGYCGLPELARAGRWREVLDLAAVRSRQLPLQPGEALVAAAAADAFGEAAVRLGYLQEATADGGAVGGVARVELAAAIAGEQPDAAVQQLLPVLAAPPSEQLAAGAVEVIEDVAPRLGAADRDATRRLGAHLSARLRRRLEVALAVDGDPATPARLARLLRESTADGAALDAATRLLARPSLPPAERWVVAQALYRHALYASAMPLLDSLSSRRHPAVPRWRVAFLRGRCAFRLGRWEEAGRWYRKAAVAARSTRDRAEMEGHVARALELAGDADGALAAASRAMRTRPNDDRRLLVIRLLLDRDERERAETVLGSVRSRAARDRGRLLLALDDLRGGAAAGARRALESVQGQGRRGPARVVAARLAVAAGEPAEALTLLESAAADHLDDFWSAQAGRIAASLPPPVLAAWRAARRRELAGSGGRLAAPALRTWAAVEPDPAQLPRGTAGVPRLAVPATVPAFPAGVAQQLWSLGLEADAARWDPGGFPAADADAALWSAQRLLALGEPRWAIRRAEEVRRRAAPGVPVRALPASLRQLLYPVPQQWAALLKAVAGEHGVPWQLLAGVVREESRWDAGALSVVGARGLTQLMPATASLAAASLGRPAPRPEELFDPEVALRLGSSELGHLLAVFGGRWAPAVAAYNAGEAQARLWLTECGASCTDDLYVLTVSFAATRGYTAGVLQSAASYAAAAEEPPSRRAAAPSPGP